MAADDPGFGIYIHWPFCAAKCPYCDFNSHVRRRIDHTAWKRALLADLQQQLADHDPQTVTTVFFGGGTPSLMAPDTGAAILNFINKTCTVSDDLEVTLEANPTSVEAEKFRNFADAGVNRVSLGVQALNDADLRALGRMHSAQEAHDALDIARRQFDRVSFDLIYGRQNQTLAQWETELDQALALAPDHVSLYQLTIEPDTRFGDMYARGRLPGLPTDDLGADMYECTNQKCTDAGLPAYEVSNHARPGAECRHNLIYWTYAPYLGVGPGAHGRVVRNGARMATISHRNPEQWLASVAETGTGLQKSTTLARDELVQEFLLMGLRLREGIALRRFFDITGIELDHHTISDLINQEFLKRSNSHLSVTDKGRPVLNALLRDILI